MLRLGPSEAAGRRKIAWSNPLILNRHLAELVQPVHTIFLEGQDITTYRSWSYPDLAQTGCYISTIFQ